jgi:SAM-dependent methyltransferase
VVVAPVRGVELYDRVAATYTGTRRPDPRIAAAIDEALGDAGSVVNVGAGAGSYEPAERDVIPIEPSEAMIAQRPPGAAPAVRATAEALPLEDKSVDAALAVFSDHHWADRPAGLREMVRVARRRVVLFTWDPSYSDRFWLTRDYLPGFNQLPGMTIEDIAACLGDVERRPVPIPHDCADGFYHAYWRRPEAYLDENVRANISIFWRLEPGEVDDAIARLRADLDSGRWHERNAELLALPEIDYGHVLLVHELG